MAPVSADKKAEKSYLSSAVDSINPWATTRSTIPPQNTQKAFEETRAVANPDDHSTTHLYGQSLRTYPPDCPPLDVQWFHAVDVPKRKPEFARTARKAAADAKPPPQPKKFSAFTPSDSKAIEAEYQKLLEATEDSHSVGLDDGWRPTRKRKAEGPNTSLETEATPATKSTTRVPVNEDFLFDVSIEDRELAPVYWLGPIYEVRRGTWFFQEGSTLRPCEENLAAQLEEGYLKLKPWLYLSRTRSRSSSKKGVTPKASRDNLKDAASLATSNTSAKQSESRSGSPQPQPQPQSHRLFGTYMNNIATYQDATTAWLCSDSMLSWVTSSMYERFAGGGYMSGIKLIRGYTEPSKSKDKEKAKDKDGKESSMTQEPIPGLDERQRKILERRSAPVAARASSDLEVEDDQLESFDAESRGAKLQRQISSLIESEGRNEAETEEEIRRRDEQEIQDDYNAQAGETQGREIEHLVLVTHGIGQLLSLRMESINFVHDVNVLRKTIKSVYANSADLKALNSELESGPGNSRVQVLPVCWRHLLDFPKRREKKGEHDLGDVTGEEDEYPSLEDITIEGVAFARSLISDLALDVLLYQSSYREQISRIVLEECNRIFRLFKERNPDFKGKIHLVGHSLGSAILFDMLCGQKERPVGGEPKNPLRFWVAPEHSEDHSREYSMEFDFQVEDFYCLGSPVGLFQMLKGRTIAARRSAHNLPSGSLLNSPYLDDPFLSNPLATGSEQVSPITGLPFSVSSPKVGQLFNIFHPSDPISYRLEPLISPAMSSLKPQLLPYTKKGIFGNVTPQGLSGIGVKVGQSVSGLWSSLSAGIANTMLNRSLGFSNEEVARMTASGQHQTPGAGSGLPDEELISDASRMGEKMDERKKRLADSAGTAFSPNGKDATLIDDELETLYSRFQQRRVESSDEAGAKKIQEDDRKARKLRAEEGKVRVLNRNGRVDYSIQESALDFNPINTIASHMTYWADEDVNHFILSQLLSRRWADGGGKVSK